MSEPVEELRSTLTNPEQSRVLRWILLTGSRIGVLLAIMTGVYVVLLALATVNPIEMRDLLTETNAAQTLFSVLLSGAILLVSIVVSINSVVLSQEITDIENQHERIDASMEFHREIENFIEADITPARPADFLSAVLYAVSTQVEALTETDGEGNEAFRDDLEEYADQVAQDIERARKTLSTTKMGTFTVLLAGLSYNYSGQLHATRGLKYKYEDEISDDSEEMLDELLTTLKYVGTGREYFKSLYYKQELAKLSSRLLFVSLPVIVFTSYVILALDAALFPEVVLLGFSPLVLFISLAYTISLAPYILLTAYIVRSATITLKTLSSGPFILQEGSEIDSLDWDPETPSGDWELTERTADD
jgi:DNA integrity scanning protein DisA with diadenylate cyclase activity